MRTRTLVRLVAGLCIVLSLLFAVLAWLAFAEPKRTASNWIHATLEFSTPATSANGPAFDAFALCDKSCGLDTLPHNYAPEPSTLLLLAPCLLLLRSKRNAHT